MGDFSSQRDILMEIGRDLHVPFKRFSRCYASPLDPLAAEAVHIAVARSTGQRHVRRPPFRRDKREISTDWQPGFEQGVFGGFAFFSSMGGHQVPLFIDDRSVSSVIHSHSDAGTAAKTFLAVMFPRGR